MNIVWAQTIETFLQQDSRFNVIPHLDVGPRPNDIAIFTYLNKIYVTNRVSDTVSVINSNFGTISNNIPVGKDPFHIAVNSYLNKIYVTNRASDTVSVINSITDKKESDDIPVGDSPIDIAVNPATNKIYVTNYFSDTVSVINGTTDKKESDDIPVGKVPYSIAVNTNTNLIYVANNKSDTVSVINGTTDKKESDDIPVGDSPIDIAVNTNTNLIYVVNHMSSTVSVIDSIKNKVSAGIIFNVDPANSGRIVCNDKEYPTNTYLYIERGTKCIAKPTKDFEFSSWIENLDRNSTIILNSSGESQFLSPLLKVLNIDPDDSLATFQVNKYGTFTANFKSHPPSIPSEYWIPLYGIIASTIIGWSIPSIIGWTRSKADVRKLNYYHQRIKSLYDDGKLDENDVKDLDKLKIDITDSYSKGKINELHYNSLKNEISLLYDKIFRKNIDCLKDSFNKTSSKEQLNNLKNDIENAYSEQKITELHYNLLNKKISDFESKDNGSAGKVE